MADENKTPVEVAGSEHSSENTPAKEVGKPQAPVMEPGKEPITPQEPPKHPDVPSDTPEDKKDVKKEANQPDPDRKTIGEGVNPDDVIPVDHEDVNIRAVQSILAASKCTEADAFAIFGKAVQSMNLADVDMKLLTEKVGESSAQLIVAGLTQWHSTVAAVHIETQKKVHEAFGGEKGWEAARAFFMSKESDPAVQTLRAMLDKGGLEAELAVQRMVSMYTNDPSTKTGQLPVNVQQAPAGGGPARNIKNKAEFATLLQKCTTIQEREQVQRDWLDSKRGRNEL